MRRKNKLLFKTKIIIRHKNREINDFNKKNISSYNYLNSNYII